MPSVEGEDFTPPSLTKNPGPVTIALVELGFVLSAYSPLMLLVGVYEIVAGRQYLGVLLVTVFLLACIAVRLILSLRSRHVRGKLHTYTSPESQGAAIASYIATFVLPFVVLPSSSAPTAAAYIAFFILILFIHVKSSLGAINPVLMLVGWSVDRVSVDGKAVFLIHKGVLKPGRLLAKEYGAIHIANDRLERRQNE